VLKDKKKEKVKFRLRANKVRIGATQANWDKAKRRDFSKVRLKKKKRKGEK